jgi:hypothetical protein
VRQNCSADNKDTFDIDPQHCLQHVSGGPIHAIPALLTSTSIVWERKSHQNLTRNES